MAYAYLMRSALFPAACFIGLFPSYLSAPKCNQPIHRNSPQGASAWIPVSPACRAHTSHTPADCTPNILQFPAASCHGLSANHIIFEISYNSPLDNDTIRQHICQPNCAIVSQPPHRYNRFLKFHHIFSPARRGSSRRTGSCPRRARNL